MAYPPIDIPEHPPLLPCPFCGRAASVTPYQATAGAPIKWSVGCWQEADAFSPQAYRDDCPGPTTLWVSLDMAVKQWNRRAR